MERLHKIMQDEYGTAPILRWERDYCFHSTIILFRSSSAAIWMTTDSAKKSSTSECGTPQSQCENCLPRLVRVPHQRNRVRAKWSTPYSTLQSPIRTNQEQPERPVAGAGRPSPKQLPWTHCPCVYGELGAWSLGKELTGKSTFSTLSPTAVGAKKRRPRGTSPQPTNLGKPVSVDNF